MKYNYIDQTKIIFNIKKSNLEEWWPLGLEEDEKVATIKKSRNLHNK